MGVVVFILLFNMSEMARDVIFLLIKYLTKHKFNYTDEYPSRSKLSFHCKFTYTICRTEYNRKHAYCQFAISSVTIIL